MAFETRGFRDTTNDQGSTRRNFQLNPETDNAHSEPVLQYRIYGVLPSKFSDA